MAKLKIPQKLYSYKVAVLSDKLELTEILSDIDETQNLPEILAQSTTGNDPIPSLCPPVNGTVADYCQRYAQQQIEEFASLGIDYSSLSAKDGNTRLSALIGQNPNLSNELILKITNPYKNMQDFPNNDTFGKATTWDKWQLSNTNKTAKKYDTVHGRKREKMARKNRQKNRK